MTKRTSASMSTARPRSRRIRILAATGLVSTVTLLFAPQVSATGSITASVSTAASTVVSVEGSGNGSSVTGPTSVAGSAPAMGRNVVLGEWIDGPCPTVDGVTVVVDFRELGGGVHVRCAPGVARSGLEALTGAGIGYQTAIRSPGFVCRIAGKPANDPCIDTSPSRAYWSYWVAPRGGQWCFSNFGAGFRTPPPGSVEGWSFSLDRTATTSPPPGVAPPAAIPGTRPVSLDGNDCVSGGSSSHDSTTTSVAPTTTRPPRSSTTVPPSRTSGGRAGSRAGVAGGGTADARGQSGASGADGPTGVASPPEKNQQERASAWTVPDDASAGSDADGQDGSVDTSRDAATTTDSHDDPTGGTNGADLRGPTDQDPNGDEASEGRSTGAEPVEMGAPVDLSGDRRSGGSVTGVVMTAVLVAVMGAVTVLRRRPGGVHTDV